MMLLHFQDVLFSSLCTFWTQGFGLLVSYPYGVPRPAAFEISTVFLPGITSFVFIVLMLPFILPNPEASS